jgi:protein-disulfide isomerase
MQENPLSPPTEPVVEPVSEPTEEIEELEEKGRSGPSVLLWSVLVAIAFVLGLVAGYFLWERPLQTRLAEADQKLAALQKTVNTSATATAGQAAAEQAAGDAQVDIPKEVKRYDVPAGNNPSLGSDKAPITIVEFSDYQCPFCLKWHQDVFTKLEEKYGDKVRLVYRDFPLSEIHPQAEPAAEAARCAGEQNKYWEYHNQLFSGQQELGKEGFLAYAQAINLNIPNFTKCVDERRYQNEVKANYDFAAQLGVRSTPTFFINGLAVVGAQPFEVFDQVIGLELAGKIPK